MATLMTVEIPERRESAEHLGDRPWMKAFVRLRNSAAKAAAWIESSSTTWTAMSDCCERLRTDVDVNLYIRVYFWIWQGIRWNREPLVSTLALALCGAAAAPIIERMSHTTRPLVL